MKSDFESEEEFQNFLKANPDIFAHKSERHHYIPQFYLKGFTNKKGLLFLYDKVKDKITEASTKSAFYEWNRNTIENNKGDKMSLLEDSVYGNLDTICSQPLKNVRESAIDDDTLNDYNKGGVLFFIANLFIRNPKYDAVFDDFIRRAKIYDSAGNQITDEDFLKKHLESEPVKKMQRAGLVLEAVKRFGEGNKDRTFYNKLIDIGTDGLLCSDFPIINFIKPSTLEGILEEEYFFPISSRRVFHTAGRVGLELSRDKIMFINTLLIDEAVRYVCGPNKQHLEECVKYYKEMKRQGLLMRIKVLLWE